MCYVFFFFQAEDGIRDLVRSRGLGDVYKRQVHMAEPLVNSLLVDGHQGSKAVLARSNMEVMVLALSLIHI